MKIEQWDKNDLAVNKVLNIKIKSYKECEIVNGRQTLNVINYQNCFLQYMKSVDLIES
jgi:hypothetical protein